MVSRGTAGDPATSGLILILHQNQCAPINDYTRITFGMRSTFIQLALSHHDLPPVCATHFDSSFALTMPAANWYDNLRFGGACCVLPPIPLLATKSIAYSTPCYCTSRAWMFEV